jgi:hypothetical protein
VCGLDRQSPHRGRRFTHLAVAPAPGAVARNPRRPDDDGDMSGREWRADRLSTSSVPRLHGLASEQRVGADLPGHRIAWRSTGARACSAVLPVRKDQRKARRRCPVCRQRHTFPQGYSQLRRSYDQGPRRRTIRACPRLSRRTERPRRTCDVAATRKLVEGHAIAGLRPGGWQYCIARPHHRGKHANRQDLR